MKYVFLLNRFSLKDNTEKLKEKIEKISRRRKINYVIEVNDKDNSTEDILSKYKNTKNVIIAVGGDGTINRVLNSIVGTKNVLGYIPYGTGNDFYKTNKEILENGINKIDLVKINDKHFINIACFGIDADIGNNNDIVHSKIIPKKQRYNMSLLYNFIKYKPRELEILINDKDIKDDFTTVVVCNGRYYGGGYKIGYNAKLDDGLLDIYLVPKINKLKTAKLIMSMKKGEHEKSKDITKYQTNKLTVRSKDIIDCNIDGEVLSSKEFNIELIEKGIEVYYDKYLINEVGKIKTKK